MSEKPYYLAIQDVSDFLRYYERIYTNDYHSRKASIINSLIPSSIMGGSVLDLGYGGGFYSSLIAKKGIKSIIALDSSFLCVEATKVNLLRNVRNTNVDISVILGQATQLPLPNYCFDLVLCIDLIEHVTKDDLLVHEISRVLKPGGKLLIATQNSSSINYLLGSFVQRLILKNQGWMGWDCTHVRFYNFKRLSRLLKSEGLEPIKVAGTYFIPYLVANRVQRLSRNLSKALYFMLRKFNDVLERWEGNTLNKYGWGIICLCVKE